LASSGEIITIGERDIAITNGDKIFFPERGHTKRDLINYYASVAEGALVGVQNRPTVLKRFVNGAAGEFFFQKRVPESRPPWMQTATVHFPSGRSATLLVIDDAAALLWAINLGCIDLNPWPVRSGDLDHPDELRVDLDPTPQATFAHVREVALVVHEILTEFGYDSYPKTSGSRGIHINVRIEPKWEFGIVRRCALALGREVERRAPEISTTAWWKEQRHGVFIDYNQNARDRTVASVYSVRPTPDARVSCALDWSEVPDVEPQDLRLDTVPARFKSKGDPGAGIDGRSFSLEPLIELMNKQEAEGLGDAPWPPNFAKQRGEPKRVQPSRDRDRKKRTGD
jgi:bifunctional non-homologous end joining protein LigD